MADGAGRQTRHQHDVADLAHRRTSKFLSPKSLPLRLLVRHYLTYDDDGLCTFCDLRFVICKER